MRKNFVTPTMLVLLVAAVVVWPAAATPAPDPPAARFEIDFMRGMVDHHAMAVHMARTCERKAIHAELQELCTDIRISQTQEMGLLQRWLREWYGVRHTPRMTPGQQQMMDWLAGLPPKTYERQFMRQMVGHHSEAIHDAAPCLPRAYHGGLYDLCTGMIAAQLDEIRLMKSWLCNWYRDCVHRRPQ